MEAYLLKLLYQILFTKIDEEPIHSAFLINHNTAFIGERTGGIGHLTAIISSRFK